MELTIEQIQEALSNDATLNEQVRGIYLNSENIGAYLESDDGKKFLQPKLDSYFSKCLDTWKNNNLQKLIDEEGSKRNPAETPEQKAMRELQVKMAKIESDKVRAEQVNIGQALAVEKGLPTSLVPYFVGDNESDTRTKMNFLELEFKSMLEKQVEARLKSASTTPIFNGNVGGSDSAPAGKDFMSMSYAERVELYEKNPKLYMQLARG